MSLGPPNGVPPQLTTCRMLMTSGEAPDNQVLELGVCLPFEAILASVEAQATRLLNTNGETKHSLYICHMHIKVSQACFVHLPLMTESAPGEKCLPILGKGHCLMKTLGI